MIRRQSCACLALLGIAASCVIPRFMASFSISPSFSLLESLNCIFPSASPPAAASDSGLVVELVQNSLNAHGDHRLREHPAKTALTEPNRILSPSFKSA